MFRASSFLTNFKKSTKRWYIVPRAMYFNPDNIPEMQNVLKALKQYQYVKVCDLSSSLDMFQTLSPDDTVLRIWTNQIRYEIFTKLVEDGIIHPQQNKKQTINDQLANLRNHTNLFNKLGLARFNNLKHLYITEMGERFIACKELYELKDVLESQLCKLQFWNPSLSKADTLEDLNAYKTYRVYPYVIILELLTLLEDSSLTKDEYLLFVSWLKNRKDLEKSRNLINRFRDVTPELQRKIIKSAKLTFPDNAQSAVTLGLFGSTQTLSFKDGKLKMIDVKRAKKLLSVFKNPKYVEYDSYEDWFSFMGDAKHLLSDSEVIEYYVDRKKDKRAKEYIEVIDNIEVKESLEEELKRLFKEKLLEDLLSANLSHLGIPNLKLVKNGRQYKTDVSNIDLLAIDKKGYIVIELKKGRTEDEAIGQVLRYMGWVHEHLSPDKEVRGVIVIGFEGATEKLNMAVKGLQQKRPLIMVKELNIDISCKP